MFIFLDESGGSTGFNRDGTIKGGSSITFNIALICCSDSKCVVRTVKSFEKRLIGKGWPKDIEIKAANLYAAKYSDDIPDDYEYKEHPELPILEILDRICRCEIDIDYFSVKKRHLHDGLKAAPFGIIYNYVAFQVLEHRLKNAIHLELIVDAQNKEIHSGKTFNGYIRTKAFEVTDTLRTINISHLDSAKDRRLRAVDFVSWSVFRRYEHGDNRFYEQLKSRMNKSNCRNWFYNK